MPLLDYASPLHTFTSSALSYTVPNNVDEAYFMITGTSTASINVTINNTIIASSYTGAYKNNIAGNGMLRLTKGDTVVLSGALDNNDFAHVFGVR